MMFSQDSWSTGAEMAQKANKLQSSKELLFVFSVIILINVRPGSLLKGFAAVKLS